MSVAAYDDEIAQITEKPSERQIMIRFNIIAVYPVRPKDAKNVGEIKLDCILQEVRLV